MSSLLNNTASALGEDGALARTLPRFCSRPAQQRLAEAVACAIDDNESLLAEAGTGTGKTFAYLVPAILSGKKTIISTGTRALQDQLYHRDLPTVRNALGVGVSTALLKGRANYLCRYRLDQARGDTRYSGLQQQMLLQRIVAWSGSTQMGDLAEIDNLPDDTPLLPAITSTAENCLGSDCPQYGECFVVQARQRAQSADVVVVNHHLLLADLALKQEGFGEILPGAEAFIIDEAHQLPELAAQFFGESIGARPLVELARDAITECKASSGALAAVQEPALALEHTTKVLRAAMEPLPIRGGCERLLQEPGLPEALDGLAVALVNLRDALSPLRETAPGLEACHVRAQGFLERIARWRSVPDPDDWRPIAVDPRQSPMFAPHQPADAEADEAAPAQQHNEPNQAPRGLAAPGQAQGSPDVGEEDDVRWYELSPRGFRLQRTPLDVSAPLREHRARSRAAWVFTSATLSVAGGFTHISKRLGLWEPRTLLQPSPFDWPSQALCYLPTHLPMPSDFGYTEAVMQAVLPVLHASKGRAFLLFSSLRALREAARILRAEADNAPWPLFVQGESSRAQLLADFLASDNGVLLGSASFREGVDVPGDALVVVVIDKLPFTAPDDPVFEARLAAVRRAGGNPFRDEQLPQAVIALKQGAGRLIRTETDHGVLVLCDPRITEKPYGRIFLNSLPPLPKTRKLADVQRFFAMEM